MSSDVLILLISSFCNLLLSSFVFFRNPKNTINRVFGLFGLSVILWTIFNYLADHVVADSLIFTRLTLMFGALIGISLVTLSFIFPRPLQTRRWLLYSYYSFAFLTVCLCLTPGFVGSVINVNQTAQLTVGELYPIYLAYLGVSLLLVLRNYYVQYRRGTGTQKSQIKLLVMAIVIYSTLAILSNAVLPVVLENWSSSRFGPLFTVPFIGITGYSMIKHRLFDIRLVVARSMAYALTLLTLTAIVVLLTFGFLARLLGTGNLSVVQEFFYVSIAIFIALTFQSIRSFFDKVSSRIFYRDAYEPQQLLDDLNKVLLSTIEIDNLMHAVSKTVAQTIKLEFCGLVLVASGEQQSRVGGFGISHSFEELDVQNLNRLARAYGKKIIIADDLTTTSTDKLRTALRDNNISAMIELFPGRGQTRQSLGYLVVGNKKSGNPSSTEDIRILEIIADELVIAIQNALRFEEIQNFAKTLQEKVDEATHKLRLTNEKLRQLDQTKDDFISMASHQLRTPLTSVKGYVSMVLEGDAGKINKQQSKLLDQAFISSQRMVYLIADLLNVSRLKTGKFVIEPKPTNLAEVVGSELEQLQETAKGRGLKLLYEQPKSFPTMNLDETKVRQVIMNFCDNAIYYTPTGGTITVNLVDKPESVELTVVDNGIGVPKSEQHHLFTKFYRAGNAKKARPDGTGLGLFMAQKVVVAQGGAIIFHSEENKGSTFGFSFPKAKLLVKKA